MKLLDPVTICYVTNCEIDLCLVMTNCS